jgi:hypothetical protein
MEIEDAATVLEALEHVRRVGKVGGIYLRKEKTILANVSNA